MEVALSLFHKNMLISATYIIIVFDAHFSVGNYHKKKSTFEKFLDIFKYMTHFSKKLLYFIRESFILISFILLSFVFIIYLYSIITNEDFQSIKNKIIGNSPHCGSISNGQQDNINDVEHIHKQKQDMEFAMTNQMTGTTNFNHMKKQFMHNKANTDYPDSITKDHSENVDNDIEIAPVIRIISNFSEKIKNNEEYYVYDPFLAFEGGYQMIVSICVSGCHEGNGTHISMYVHLMKGPHDDELQQLGYWPFSGVIEIALLNQFKDECHCYKYIALDENVLSNCTARVTVDSKIGFGCGLDQGWLLSGLNNTVFLRNDSLHFRISFRRYIFQLVLKHTVLEIPTFLKINLYNFVIVFAALMFVEFIRFCSGETVLKPRLLNFGSVIVFLFANMQTTICTGFNVLCRTLKRFLTLMVVVALYVLMFAATEVLYSDMSTALGRYWAFQFVAQRICEILMWSCAVEVYKMSWGSNFPMIGPMWILHLLSLDLYQVLLSIYKIYSVVYVPLVCILLLYDVVLYTLYKNKVDRFILRSVSDFIFFVLLFLYVCTYLRPFLRLLSHVYKKLS